MQLPRISSAPPCKSAPPRAADALAPSLPDGRDGPILRPVYTM